MFANKNKLVAWSAASNVKLT